ncbi:unnamed protein product [Amoebophrya sp. A25]|nr:unnamed protein product [Amoebophrya sp. A25]|eukprot:GSA25T00018774001.1
MRERISMNLNYVFTYCLKSSIMKVEDLPQRKMARSHNSPICSLASVLLCCLCVWRDVVVNANEKVLELIEEFTSWPDPGASQCHALEFRAPSSRDLDGSRGTGSVDRLHDTTAVDPEGGNSLLRYQDVVVSIEEHFEVAGNTTQGASRRQRLYENVLALGMFLETLLPSGALSNGGGTPTSTPMGTTGRSRVIKFSVPTRRLNLPAERSVRMIVEKTEEINLTLRSSSSIQLKTSIEEQDSSAKDPDTQTSFLESRLLLALLQGLLLEKEVKDSSGREPKWVLESDGERDQQGVGLLELVSRDESLARALHAAMHQRGWIQCPHDRRQALLMSGAQGSVSTEAPLGILDEDSDGDASTRRLTADRVHASRIAKQRLSSAGVHHGGTRHKSLSDPAEIQTSGTTDKIPSTSEVARGVTLPTRERVVVNWHSAGFPSATAEIVFRQQFEALGVSANLAKKAELEWVFQALRAQLRKWRASFAHLYLRANGCHLRLGHLRPKETNQKDEEVEERQEKSPGHEHHSKAVVREIFFQHDDYHEPARAQRRRTFYHTEIFRQYPYYNAKARAVQETLSQIRKGLRYPFPDHYYDTATPEQGYQYYRDQKYHYRDRHRHTFSDFTDKLEAYKVHDGLGKYTSMGAMYAYFLLTEGFMSFQKLLYDKCFPASLLFAAVYHHDKFLEVNGDIWAPIYEAQRNFALIQTGIQRFDIMAQTASFRVGSAWTDEDMLGPLSVRGEGSAVEDYPEEDEESRPRGGGGEHAGVRAALDKVKSDTTAAFRVMYESQAAGNEMFALEMSHEHTADYRRGNLTKEKRMQNYKDVLWEINHLFTDVMQIEWAPKGGTLMAFLRYAANSHPSEEHHDLENDDIDLFIGAESETHSQHIMLEITERLKRSPHGAFHCFGKSVHHAANFTWRNDLLFCMRKEPVLMLLDIGSYLKLGNLAVSHRLCEGASQFTSDPVNCEVHNELVFQKNNITLDEIYPSEKCRAWNMTLPCPVPEKALKTVMIGGPSGKDASCPYLPTRSRLEKWNARDWMRLLDSMEELAGGFDSDGDGVPDTEVLNIKPYIWDDAACRLLVEENADRVIVERVKKCCAGVADDMRRRYRYFGPESGRQPRKGELLPVPYDYSRDGVSTSGQLDELPPIMSTTVSNDEEDRSEKMSPSLLAASDDAVNSNAAAHESRSTSDMDHAATTDEEREFFGDQI